MNELTRQIRVGASCKGGGLPGRALPGHGGAEEEEEVAGDQSWRRTVVGEGCVWCGGWLQLPVQLLL